MDEKILAYLADMRRRGVRFGTYAPPLWRVAWWLGVPMPPIFFWPTWGLSVFLGGIYGAGIFFVFVFTEPYREQPLQLWQIATLGLAGGTAFGTIFALITRWTARKLRLPRDWANYSPSAEI